MLQTILLVSHTCMDLKCQFFLKCQYCAGTGPAVQPSPPSPSTIEPRPEGAVDAVDDPTGEHCNGVSVDQRTMSY